MSHCSSALVAGIHTAGQSAWHPYLLQWHAVAVRTVGGHVMQPGHAVTAEAAHCPPPLGMGEHRRRACSAGVAGRLPPPASQQGWPGTRHELHAGASSVLVTPDARCSADRDGGTSGLTCCAWAWYRPATLECDDSLNAWQSLHPGLGRDPSAARVTCGLVPAITPPCASRWKLYSTPEKHARCLWPPQSHASVKIGQGPRRTPLSV